MKRRPKSPQRSNPSKALVAMMVAAGCLVRDLDVACQRHGITHDQYNVLRILRGAHPEGHPRGEIAARLISRSPDVTRMLDRLVNQGLVGRGGHPTNRRLSIATITEKGLALLAEADHDIAREQARHVSDLSGAELETLERLCKRMSQ